MKQSQITFWCHEVIRLQAPEGGFYIDATMGKGNDTLFLCELAKEKGKVLAFDIQKDALIQTEALLKKHGVYERAELLEFLKELPPKEYTVIINEYWNRGNHPPMPVFVFKGKEEM